MTFSADSHGMRRSFCLIRIVKLVSIFTLFSAASPLIAETYTVEKGDTLYGIGRRFGVSVDNICKANDMDKNSCLQIGQVLDIPTSANTTNSENVAKADKKYEIYTVKKGDSLFRIGLEYDLTVTQLANYNSLDENKSLQIGQELKIPVAPSEIQISNFPSITERDPRNYGEKKGDSSLLWPVKNPDVTYIIGKVGGVQLSASKNEKVNSIHGGTVLYTGNYRGYGNVVIVVTDDQMKYIYAGLDSIKVKKGDTVDLGTTLGLAGTDSIKGIPQISLIVYEQTTPIDPAKAPRG